MRRWLWLLALPIALFGYSILTNIGAPQALASIANQPILALTKDGQRIPVQLPGQRAKPDEARNMGGTGILFGYQMPYTLPNGQIVTCQIRFSTVTCTDDWTAERKVN